MPKSRENVIAELNARNISYDEAMEYKELTDLLKKADEAEKPVEIEEEIDYTGIRCGLSTIADLHRRVTILERKCLK